MYNFSNVLLILHVKYFAIGYDLKLSLTKVVGGQCMLTCLDDDDDDDDGDVCR